VFTGNTADFLMFIVEENWFGGNVVFSHRSLRDGKLIKDICLKVAKLILEQ